MPAKKLLMTALAASFCVALAGCDGNQARSRSLRKKEQQPQIVVPPHVKDTVAEFAALVGGADLPVQAHGIVVGLGENGSAEVPAHLRKLLSEYLVKKGMGSHRLGTADATPDRILRSQDTSVVLVAGSVPAGAPAGTLFDLFVTCLPQTQTRSLEGGRLMDIDLSLAYAGVSRPGATTKVWAEGSGAVFVNPFLTTDNPQDIAALRSGRIIGGGRVTIARDIRLQLIRPDYEMADLIRRRIVERFDEEDHILFAKVAKAKSRSTIELTVPSEYRQDYAHFLSLVMHLPVRYGEGGWEVFARQVARNMDMPTADHEELSLIWEAMGRQVVPIVRGYYGSSNPATAFYAARAGIRLGDASALDLLLRLAQASGSPHRLAAVEELGRHRQYIHSQPVLRQLLDDENELVRVAAFEALQLRGDAWVERIDLPGQFEVYRVKTARQFSIYATQTGVPRVVLFGRDMAVRRPVFFESRDGLITINALADSEGLTLYRRIPQAHTTSEPLVVDCGVHSLVRTLGCRPELDDNGLVSGLGLTYGQVIGVLYRMCEEGSIPAKFVLQQDQGIQRIYQRAATIGRPDMPDQ